MDGSGGTTRNDAGLYVSFDQALWREDPKHDDGQGLGAFFRFGFADPEYSEIARFYSAGCQYQGLIPKRDNDVLGFGVAFADLSSKADFSATNEIGLEIYYNAQITPWCHITPEVQYIINPGGDKSVDDALVLGIRAVINF